MYQENEQQLLSTYTWAIQIIPEKKLNNHLLNLIHISQKVTLSDYFL